MVRKGSKVRHASYGEGIVTDVFGGYALVEFTNIGVESTKTLPVCCLTECD